VSAGLVVVSDGRAIDFIPIRHAVLVSVGGKDVVGLEAVRMPTT